MDPNNMVEQLRQGKKVSFPREAGTRNYAKSLDRQDQLRHLREQFKIPTKSQLKIKALGEKKGTHDPFQHI